MTFGLLEAIGRTPIVVDEGWQTETLQEGDLVHSKGRTFVWGPNHLKNSELEPWRQLSDTNADKALATLSKLSSANSGGLDSPFNRIKTYIQAVPIEQRDPDIQAFWSEATALPHVHCQGDDGILKSNMESSGEQENIRAFLVEGQQVYVKYAGPTSLALLHYSLAGGFSSPRITRVLELTSYLIPRMSESTGCPLSSSAESRERSDKATYERLLETAQWVLDCMDGLEAILPPTGPGDPGGRGWEATVQVRLLHAQMRAQVLGRAKVYATKGDNDTAYSVTVDGVPLNQEDMAATLGAFSVAPIWSLERMGFHLSAREKEAYLFLWRYLGYYLGIRNLILDRHFSSWARAEAFLLSSVLHLFAFRKTPEQLARLPTIPVLRAVSGRPPFRSSLRYNLAISRSLLGDEFASDLGIPSTTFYSWMQVQLSFVTMRVPVLFGQFYPRKRWEWKRREVIRRALPRVVIWGLGGRRTNFVVGKDKWCTVDMKSDRWVRDGQEIMRMWKEIWRELSLVVAGCICVGTIVGYGVWASLS